MFNINDRFDFFDEPIKMFGDNGIDFYFEKDRRIFKNSHKPYFLKRYCLEDMEPDSIQNIECSNYVFYTSSGNEMQYKVNEDTNFKITLTLQTSTPLFYAVVKRGGAFYVYIYFNQTNKYFYNKNGSTNNYQPNTIIDFTSKEFYIYTLKGDTLLLGLYKGVKMEMSTGHDPNYYYNIKRIFNNKNNILKEKINRNFNNKDIINPFKIKKYVNKQNFVFERISFKQISPKRVIIRDFNE